MASAEQFLARTQRRSRRGTHVLLAIGVGLLAAASMSLIAGSRRSSSVVDRFFASAPTYDLTVYSDSGGLDPDAVRALPGVEAADPAPYIAFTALGIDPGMASINSSAADFSVANPTVQVLRGHAPDGTNDFEVVVNEAFAEQVGADVGDRAHVVTYAPDQYDEIQRGVYEPRGPTYDFTVDAVVRTPDDISFDEQRSPRPGFTSAENVMLVSTGFWLDHRSEFIDFGTAYSVRLADGPAGTDAFVAAAQSLAGPDAQVLSQPWAATYKKSAFAAPVALETAALLGVGIGAALGALVLALLLLRLDHRGLETEQSALRAMGMTTAGLSRVAVRRTTPAAITAAVIAIGGSILMSTRFPIGIGRQLEIDGGVAVNLAVVILGAAAILAVLLGAAALMARRSPATSDLTAPRRAPRLLSASRLPLHAALGARLARGAGDQRARASNAAGIAAAAVATATVLAVGIWLVGTQRLYSEPATRGWRWDIAVGNVNFPLDPATADSVEHSPLVTAATAVSYGQATLNDASVELLAFDPAGTAPPEIVHGRLPASPSEAALGAGLLRQLHLAIGDNVTLSMAGSEFVDDATPTTDVTLTVVGESVSPLFGESDIADVGVVPLAAIAAAGGDATPRIVLADVAGPDRAANLDALIAPYTEEVKSDVIASRIVNMHRVRAVPTAGLLLAAAFGLMALVATVFSGGRVNRRIFAVLGALGLDRRRTRRVVGWQGLLTAAAILLIGVPLGLAAATVWWRRVADGLGVKPDIPFAPWLIALVVASALVAGIAAAFAAARRARTSVAEALRTE